MKALLLLVVLLAGCATAPHTDNPPMPPGGPNWAEVDKSVQRAKDREKNKPRFVETTRTDEQGFRAMSDDDYAAVLDAARTEVWKAHPKWTEADVEREALARADKAKWDYEHAWSHTMSSTYELQKP